MKVHHYQWPGASTRLRFCPPTYKTRPAPAGNSIYSRPRLIPAPRELSFRPVNQTGSVRSQRTLSRSVVGRCPREGGTFSKRALTIRAGLCHRNGRTIVAHGLLPASPLKTVGYKSPRKWERLDSLKSRTAWPLRSKAMARYLLYLVWPQEPAGKSSFEQLADMLRIWG